MKKRSCLVFAALITLVFIAHGLALAQESGALDTQAQPQASQGSTAQGGAIPVPVAASTDTQWVYGEVVTKDTQNKGLIVKYLDYESGQEKDMEISTDEKTTYENVKSLDEVNPQDAVSVDYIISSNGKNVAKNISVEKMDPAMMPSAGGPMQEVVPDSLQSTAPVPQ